MVVKDRSPSHVFKQQIVIYMKTKVLKLLWPGNSSDLNIIESCQNWIKRETTQKGAPQTQTQAEHI